MIDEPGSVPAPRTVEELRAFALQLQAAYLQFADDLRDLSSPMPPDTLARALALDQDSEQLKAWSVDLAVRQVTVPDYPPGAGED